MKTARSSDSGSVLLATIVTCAIIGITLASYLQYSVTQTKSIARSAIWNAAIPAAEAGVEEALAHLNSCADTNYAVNGWNSTWSEFQRSNNINGVAYYVRMTTNTMPIIFSTAYTRDPRSGFEYRRQLRVSTSRHGTGAKGLVAKGNVSMNGTTAIDSFDSEDPRYSTQGRYDPTKNKDGGYVASVNGNVTATTVYGSVGTGPTGTATGTVGTFGWTASNTGIQPGYWQRDVNYSFPEVEVPFNGGAASPGPGSYTLTNYTYATTTVVTNAVPNPLPAGGVTTNVGSMTSTSFPNGVPSNLITTNWTPMRTRTAPAAGTYQNLTQHGQWYEYDLRTGYTWTDITYTYSSVNATPTTTTDNYTYRLDGDRYEMASVSLSGQQKMLITGTNVTLYVPGDFTMQGQSEIIIAPGASFNLYVGGRTELAGNGIMNYTTDATKFRYYGLPGNTRIDIQGNASFTGIIYAPDADIRMGGGGNTVYDVVGSVIAKTADLNGHFRFHYDERIGRDRTLSKFTAASWQEL